MHSRAGHDLKRLFFLVLLDSIFDLKIINANNFLQQMDVSNYSNGEYIVIIQLKNEIITKKISVIR